MTQLRQLKNNACYPSLHFIRVFTHVKFIFRSTCISQMHQILNHFCMQFILKVQWFRLQFLKVSIEILIDAKCYYIFKTFFNFSILLILQAIPCNAISKSSSSLLASGVFSANNISAASTIVALFNADMSLLEEWWTPIAYCGRSERWSSQLHLIPHQNLHLLHHILHLLSTHLDHRHHRLLSLWNKDSLYSFQETDHF